MTVEKFEKVKYSQSPKSLTPPKVLVRKNALTPTKSAKYDLAIFPCKIKGGGGALSLNTVELTNSD